MPNSPRYLIDTNVFIGLEDPGLVNPQLSALVRVAARHQVSVYIHEAARDDIARDRNARRRDESLSRLAKFLTLAKVRGLTKEALSEQYGPLRKPNDIVDATLLNALDIGAVDFLVTEDHGLHERAARHSPHLVGQVLYVADALSLLRITFEPRSVPLRFIDEVDAHTIPLSEPIFESLRDGYPTFDQWWREKCVARMRRCWIVNDDGRIAGLVVRKEETSLDTDATLPGSRFLKICTFKVSPESRGIKLGELLLRQVLWFAQRNAFDVTYLTTFQDQSTLIDLLSYYGFQQTYVKDDGELVFEKRLAGPIADPGTPAANVFDLDRYAYPRFYIGGQVPLFGIPIREEYHRILFPDIDDPPQQSLFPTPPRRPGNTIRKVYLSRTKKSFIEPGAVVMFYKGKSKQGLSQAVTTVGVAEDMSLAFSTAQLRRLAGGRSVYSERQLLSFQATPENPVKVLNFLLCGHLEQPITLAELLELGVFKGHPAQSMFRVDPQARSAALKRLDLPMSAT